MASIRQIWQEIRLRLAMIGLGKLGLPVSVALAERGHQVVGYDSNPERRERYRRGISGLYEPDMDSRLRAVLGGHFQLAESTDEAVAHAELTFIAVPTPHSPGLDGSSQFSGTWQDFDYSMLVEAARSVATSLRRASESQIVSIISTVLPGTTRNRVYPVMQEVIGRPLGEGWELLYNPSFIAMGQTISDYLNPEFSLIGHSSSASGIHAVDRLSNLYRSIHSAPILPMSWTEAEAVKMFYNTFIGLKIVFANTVMQLCHELGANTDVVTDALGQASDRLISSKYLRGGMGDGGGCHPRDNMALAYLSDELGLDYNLFAEVMSIRERQAQWLARLLDRHGLPIVIMGRTYKPNTNLTDGSPSMLVADLLRVQGRSVEFFDPETDPNPPGPEAAAFLIGTTWPQFQTYPYPFGSVVIDPWGMIEGVPAGVTLISVGRSVSGEI